MYYDLHMHSCLSPCAENEMTPNNICNMALIKGLDLIAVTDHNSVKQLPAFAQAAKTIGIRALYGCEIQTIEEVHVLGLFAVLEQAMKLQEWIDLHMPDIPNQTDYFGDQWICNAQDEMLEQEPRLLLVSLDVSLEETVVKIHELGGRVILAHVLDRENSVTNQLGFIPMDLTYDVGAMKFFADGEEIDFTYEDGVIVLTQDKDSMILTKTERPTSTPTPAAATWPGTSAKRVGMDDIGYFNIPEDWIDLSHTEDPAAIILHYISADGNNSLIVHSYTKGEWESFGSEYGELDAWVKAFPSSTAIEYADKLISEIYDLPVYIAGYDGTRADLLFSDDSALTNVIFKDDAETIHILTMETFTADSTTHIDDFVNYIVDSFAVNQ